MRSIILVIDGFGVGEAPDAAKFKDQNSNTFLHVLNGYPELKIPTLTKLGLKNIDGLNIKKAAKPIANFARLQEVSSAKDSTTGHWELCGLVTENPPKVFPKLPRTVWKLLENIIGRKILCGKAYSGTEVIKDFGDKHTKTGYPIIYTSADSVIQIAANEAVVPLNELYEMCRKVREAKEFASGGQFEIGRVIARPFVKTQNGYERTENRHDYALNPHGKTLLNELSESKQKTIAVGKIYDLFNGYGITKKVEAKGNTECLKATLDIMKTNFKGLLFTNLVDTDMLYGHRNDVIGYAKALEQIDKQLAKIIKEMREDDLLIVTADHGCDPGHPSTDHTREYVPALVYHKKMKEGTNKGTLKGFAEVAKTVRYWQKLSKDKPTLLQ